MKLFDCNNCGQILYFENIQCENCGYTLGFDAEKMDLLTIHAVSEDTFQDILNPEQVYKYCYNEQYHACNWLIPADSETSFCKACTLNRTIPNLEVTGNLELWQRVERAKHRLVYTLLKLELPVSESETDPAFPLHFDFLCGTEEEHILTGHEDGLITLNVLEADKIVQEQTRAALGERYRTLIGHFRHETGHYYWMLLVQNNADVLAGFRNLFGDERADYQAALKTHYEKGREDFVSSKFISHYASAHPWEDWAETWAHYLHMLDTLETAYSYGLQLDPRTSFNKDFQDVHLKEDPFLTRSADELVRLWIPVTIMINSMNRSMGQPDVYPFVLSDQIAEKFSFIHRLCWSIYE